MDSAPFGGRIGEGGDSSSPVPLGRGKGEASFPLGGASTPSLNLYILEDLALGDTEDLKFRASSSSLILVLI